MPKTTLLLDDKKYYKLRVLIRGSAAEEKKGVIEFAKIIGYKDWRTAKKLLEKPQDMTLDQLSKLGRSLSMPIEELREAAIRY